MLEKARNIAVLTGAGISKESGIETFRDADGAWSKFDPMIWATVEGFKSQPKEVWNWYQERRQTVRDNKPNPGHFSLAAMEKLFDSFSIATQNIDGYHKLAGSSVIRELHGNIFRNKCLDEDLLLDDFDNSTTPPTCPRCGGMVRPDVVWFGEMLPDSEWEQAREDAQKCDLYLVVGTSGMVWPAAGLPTIAKRKGAKVIIINPHETEIDQRADLIICEKSGVALPSIEKLLE